MSSDSGTTEGPYRLSSQDDTQLPLAILPLHSETPLISFLSTTLSASEVFVVDSVVVMFAGLPTGDVRKVQEVVHV